MGNERGSLNELISGRQHNRILRLSFPSTVANAPRHPLAAFLPAQWAVDAERAMLVAKVAQKIGCVAGVLTGCYDIFFNGTEAWKDHKKLLGTLYLINGVLGVAVALAGYYVSAIFWPLLILSFIVGIAIALISASALQEWISRCYFSKSVSLVRAATHGNPPFKPYPYATANAEFNAYQSALGA